MIRIVITGLRDHAPVIYETEAFVLSTLGAMEPAESPHAGQLGVEVCLEGADEHLARLAASILVHLHQDGGEAMSVAIGHAMRQHVGSETRSGKVWVTGT